MVADGSWTTWLLQGLIVLGIGRVWLAIDKNTESLSKLREDIPKVYATKDDVNRHDAQDAEGFSGMRMHLSELRDRVWNLDNRVTSMDGNASHARAGLREPQQ